MTTAQASAWSPPASCRPPVDDPRLDFVAQAEAFAKEHAGRLPFRFLRAFTRCAPDELLQLIGKIYCEAAPECAGPHETLPASLLKGLALPLKFLAGKTWSWTPEKPVLFDLELNNPAHLRDYYAELWELLPSPKRISPTVAAAEFPGSAPTAPTSSTIAPRSLPWLLASIVCLPSLWLLSLRAGRNLMAPFRRALGAYAVFDGHFRRYPCRDFISYDDVINHPCRYLAFKQNGEGRFSVVQNGTRVFHPSHAFGMVDDYFSFGRFQQRLAPELKIKPARVHPVGCLNLDRWKPLHDELARGPQEPLYDVLLLDQGLWPFNGQDFRTGREAMDKVFANLNELKRRRPELRAAVQMRGYAGHVEHETLVRQTHARFFTEPIAILENTGKGESYRSVYRSRVVLTVTSTLGFEAYFFRPGVKTLFLDYAENPFAVCSLDPRYQLYDAQGSFDAFAARVDELLKLELDAPPAVAQDQLEAFDGKTQRRIAAILCGKDLPS